MGLKEKAEELIARKDSTRSFLIAHNAKTTTVVSVKKMVSAADVLWSGSTLRFLDL